MENREETILSSENILDIKLLLEKNSKLLEENIFFKQLETNDIESENKLRNILPEEYQELFSEYIQNNYEIASCNAYISYLIGLKKGINIGKETANIDVEKI